MAKGKSLLAYALTRGVLAVPMLLILLTMVFFVLRVLQGDPVLALWHGREPPPAVVEEARRELCLDRPPWVQYARYIARIFLVELGVSIGEVYHWKPWWGEIAVRL